MNMNVLDQRFGRLICGALLVASSARAADTAVQAAPAAAYESGGDIVPVRQLEQQIRDAAGDGVRRAACEAALLRLLEEGSTFEAKRFACSGLAVIGSDASLPALDQLLKREETAGIACLALGGLRSAQAGERLRAALAETRGAVRLQLVNALGTRAEAASVEPLVQLARDADVALACAAVRALGGIDANEARTAVAALRREGAPEWTEAVGAASLRGAEQSFACGDRASASAVCAALLAPAWPVNIRRGALSLLLRNDGDLGEQRVRTVLSAKPSDPALVAVAIGRVPALRGEGVSKLFGELLPGLPPGEQVLMVEALAARGDAAARSVLRAQTSAADGAVRCAALAAVGEIEGAAAVDMLVQALISAPTPDERKMAQTALAALKGGEAADRAVIDALRTRKGDDKLPLLAVLSMRGGRLSAAELLTQGCASDEALARAASQGLVRIAGSGDATALVALQEALAGDDTRKQEVALRALVAWRGLAAWDTLAKVYLNAGNEARRTLALRGLVRTASEADAAPDASLVDRYRQLLTGARGADDRRLILSVLSGATHPDALALALPLLDDPAVRPQAEEAVARLAKALATTHPAAARAALRRLQKGN